LTGAVVRDRELRFPEDVDGDATLQDDDLADASTDPY
jgi:hypothetical protein